MEFIQNPMETVSVPVTMINNSVTGANRRNFNLRRKKLIFNNIRVKGAIFNGDWDLDKECFINKAAYGALNKRFVENSKWEDTQYFKHFQDDLKKNGQSRGGTTSFDQFKAKYLNKWDILYENIVQQGYKSQVELKSGSYDYEVEVVVSREGELLFVSGKHRLSIAKLLNIKNIPVVVNVWHEKYIRWVKQSLKLGKLTPAIAIIPIIRGELK
ncbi:MAG: hypothetical protein D5R98_09730 [Desulfonatronovibrio sp. MSAO_Bac4]|nr:MAG: hypothetical protein D5R98_09730 [Desulfonatronovibrio sp. MSAO_Bac4]